jgi:hypothetical protein
MQGRVDCGVDLAAAKPKKGAQARAVSVVHLPMHLAADANGKRLEEQRHNGLFGWKRADPKGREVAKRADPKGREVAKRADLKNDGVEEGEGRSTLLVLHVLCRV